MWLQVVKSKVLPLVGRSLLLAVWVGKGLVGKVSMHGQIRPEMINYSKKNIYIYVHATYFKYFDTQQLNPPLTGYPLFYRLVLVILSNFLNTFL